MEKFGNGEKTWKSECWSGSWACAPHTIWWCILETCGRHACVHVQCEVVRLCVCAGSWSQTYGLWTLHYNRGNWRRRRLWGDSEAGKLLVVLVKNKNKKLDETNETFHISNPHMHQETHTHRAFSLFFQINEEDSATVTNHFLPCEA